jgi:actin-like ATPase involved in cell morphogenesis
MNEDIIRYCRDEFNLLIGEKTAEDVKMAIGSACPQKEKMQMEVRGRDLVTGLPKEIILTDEQARIALSRSIRIIINNIKKQFYCFFCSNIISHTFNKIYTQLYSILNTVEVIRIEVNIY